MDVTLRLCKQKTMGGNWGQLKMFFCSSLLAPGIFWWELLGAHLISGLDRLSGPSNQARVSNDMNLLETWKNCWISPESSTVVQFNHSKFPLLKKWSEVVLMSLPASNLCVSCTPPHIQIPEQFGRRDSMNKTHKMLIERVIGWPWVPYVTLPIYQAV